MMICRINYILDACAIVLPFALSEHLPFYFCYKRFSFRFIRTLLIIVVNLQNVWFHTEKKRLPKTWKYFPLSAKEDLKCNLM